jgi:hypothetical protein
MAYNDHRGAQYDYDIIASAGINETWTVTASGVAVDLTGSTISVQIKDDDQHAKDYGGRYGYHTTYSMDIIDAANGQFRFLIPPDEFDNLEGGRMTYEMRRIDSSGRSTAKGPSRCKGP